MLPLLYRNNGCTPWVFQILLIAQARSGLREWQLLTCHLVRALNLVREKATGKLATNFSTFLILGVWLNVYLSLQKVTIVFIYVRGKSVFSTV
jgi:hypothetical protein